MNGKTRLMRNIRKPAPRWVHRHQGQPGDRYVPYANPDKDRALAGKARRLARKAARR